MIRFFIPSLIFATSVFAASIGDPLEKSLDRAAAKAIAEKRIVGAVILVSRDDSLIYRKAHGLADRESNIPMKVETAFRLSSLTKPIVLAAFLRLADEGKVALDQPVTEWIPDFRPKTEDGKTPEILIRHLLTHTAGLNYGFWESEDGPYRKLGISDGLDDSGITLEENIRRISKAPLLYEPGKGWQYSVAADVLGKVIEKATGKDLETAVSELVTIPLNMKVTKFVAGKDDFFATPYANQGRNLVLMDKNFHTPFGGSSIIFDPGRIYQPSAFLSGGSGMMSNADEYISFLEVIRKGGRPLLKKETNESIFTPAIGNNSTGEAGWTWGVISALLDDPVKAGTPMGKGTIRWGGVYGHTWWIDRVNKLSVVILTNTSLEGVSGDFPNEIRDAVYNNLK